MVPLDVEQRDRNEARKRRANKDQNGKTAVRQLRMVRTAHRVLVPDPRRRKQASDAHNSVTLFPQVMRPRERGSRVRDVPTSALDAGLLPFRPACQGLDAESPALP